jgi:hypothetical protein
MIVAARSELRRVFGTVFVAGAISAALGLAAAACAQVPGTESIQAVFSLKSGEVAAYDPTQMKIRTFVEQRGELHEKGSVATDGMLMAVAPSIKGGFVYATGVARADPLSPLRVHLMSEDLKADRVTYEYSGERNQVTGLVWNGPKLWVNFYESKYFTKVGYLTPRAATHERWEFTEVARLRMGDSFDCLGDTLVVGRSYGDQQGEDGDLLLFRKGERQLLPSYRGVRAVKLFGSPENPSIAIADGWHANYGQVAQARVSLLHKRNGEERYALELIDRDTSNYGFSRLFVFDLKGTRRIAALGNSSLVVYSETAQGAWKKESLYTQSAAGMFIDAAPIRIDGSAALFAISDGGLRTVAYNG